MLVAVAIGIVGISAFPAHPDPNGPGGYASDLGTTCGCARRCVGIVDALHGHMPHALVDVLRVVIGLSGALILVAAITTSISGAGRLAYSLGQHATCSRTRSASCIAPLADPAAWRCSARPAISAAILVGADVLGTPVRSLASLYSFGVLLAFTAAQVAVDPAPLHGAGPRRGRSACR